MCVLTLFFFLLSLFPYLCSQGGKTLLLLLYHYSFLGESPQSSLSVTLLCLCSLFSTCFLSTSKPCHMFLMARGYSTRFPQCVCKSTLFSEVEIRFYTILFRFLPLAQCTLVCLRSWGHSQYFTILAMQGNGEKIPQPSIDNYLNLFCSFSWQADLNTNIEDESRSFYGVSSQYESPENMVITCSTKVCSFGKQVVEKVEVRSRHLGARFPLAAVSSLQVFASCLCISRQNISHASCQGDGCHRYKITQPAK